MTNESEHLSHGKSREELDEFAFRHIGTKWHKFELGLFQSKWFDYRFLHPVEASALYAEIFGTIYRRFYAQTVDAESAAYITVPSAKRFLFANQYIERKMIGIWRGRQVADFLGIPYDVYINAAMENRLRFWKQRSLPQPQQLYSEIIVDKMPDVWKQRQEAKLYYSSHSNYRNEFYKGYPWQNDHHEWLFHTVSTRSSPEVYLSRFMEEGLLPREKVQSRMGDELFEKALSI